ncbi:hypothetical protein [Paenibacillus sp. NPDC057934]|uniref:hypothetical protein n=1 Tax=Paenibacillus sp. NPDC057934 TaxID=3346282 RepID=UPI0036DFA194
MRNYRECGEFGLVDQQRMRDVCRSKQAGYAAEAGEQNAKKVFRNLNAGNEKERYV